MHRKIKSRRDSFYEVRSSTIKGAGNGLFSKKRVKPGETIGYYTGKVLSDEETELPEYIDSDYILMVCKDHNICGEGPSANYTRFINHHKRPNSRIVSSYRWKTARIEAIETILPGQEIFLDYGPYYWDR